MPAAVPIVFLHHSTGEAVWRGGLPRFIRDWNRAHGTSYELTELTYPACAGAHTRLRRHLPARLFNALFKDHYPWSNYPYDYWNLWVRHGGSMRDRGELNLADLARDNQMIVFKHCFPVSAVRADDGAPDLASPVRTLANYRLQYEALKARMHQYPQVKFLVWTGPPLLEGVTSPDAAARAREFADWLKGTWEEPGDNIFLWDYRQLATDGGLYLHPERGTGPADSHPSPGFAAKVAPLLGRRIVDVIEGRGDSGSCTGE
jgi:hypothetical protein